MTTSKKIHLLLSDDPVGQFCGLTARCGYVFASATPVWMFRQDFKPGDGWLDGFNILLVCRKCLGPWGDSGNTQYIYGLVESQMWASHFEEEGA